MGKFIDITNQKFGYLTALYPTRLYGRFAWHCVCDCGKEIDVESNNLRTNKVQSCGCQKAKLIGTKNSKNIVGEKFNHLTVLEKTDLRQCGAIVWKCKCDCGNITFVPTGNLKSGHTTSCGKCKIARESKQQLDLIGKKFNHLLVIEKLPNQNNQTYWKCKCDCGNFCTAIGWMLTNDKIKSCGCIKTSYGEEKISQLLSQNNIKFEAQKTFENCRYPNSNRKAIFDFFVDNKYIIEYDGEQHFLSETMEKGYYTKDKIKTIQAYDAFKEQWCQENNIPLIRIPYFKYKTLTLNDLLLKGE